jgi:hypothetical protein
MNVKLQLFLVVTSVAFTGIIFVMLRKELLELKYTLVWIFAGISMIIISLFPKIIFGIAQLVGIIQPVNVLFLMGIFFSLLIIFSLTIALSRQSERTKKLAQEIALLEKEFRNLKIERD